MEAFLAGGGLLRISVKDFESKQKKRKRKRKSLLSKNAVSYGKNKCTENYQLINIYFRERKKM